MQNISVYYYCSLLFVFISGLITLFKLRGRRGQSYIKFRRNILKSAKNELKVKLNDPAASRLMFESGIRMDSIKYNTYRYVLLTFFVGSQCLFWMSEGDFSVKKICLGITIFLLSIPNDKYLGFRTPFGYILEALQRYRKSQIDKELFETMTQLKNLCIAQASAPMSGDYLIEQLLKFSNLTKPAYTKLLSLWRLGCAEEGCEVFATLLNTKMSNELSSIFIKLEKINPVELASQLELFQNHVREERMTSFQKKQEALSYVLYSPVIASAFMIMLNFMIIVIWMDTMDLMQKL